MVEFLSILVVVVLFCYFLYYKNKKYREEQEMDRIANAPNMSVGSEVLPLNNNNMEENQNLSTRDLCAEVLRKLNCVSLMMKMSIICISHIKEKTLV